MRLILLFSTRPTPDHEDLRMSSHATRFVHEIAFSANAGIAIMAIFYTLRGHLQMTASLYLDLVDRAICRRFHLSYGGYFGFFLPALILAVLIWTVLKLLSNT